MSENEELINNIYSIGDILEYSKAISEVEVLGYLNKLKNEILENDNYEIKEACIDVICIGFLHQVSAKKFDIEFLVKYIQRFSSETTENIITIMGFSGQKKYRDLICKYLVSENRNIVDAAKEALETLDFMTL